MTSVWYQALGALESFPVLDTVTKEVVGINIPKIVVTRSDTERMDVAVSEIGNTVAFGVGGVAAEQLFKKAFETAQQASSKSVPYQWAVIGRSLGIYSVIFSLMWAMPFIRNYITAKRTGSVRFTDVIASGHRHQPGDAHDRKAALQHALDYYRGKALTILGLGLGGAAASVGLTRLAASSTREIGKDCLKRIFNSWAGKNLLLKGGQFSKFGGWPALLFWGVPAYGGWLHASRDPYEKKEQVLKFANFVACFFGPPVLMNRWYQNKFQQAFPNVKLKELSYSAINKTFSGNEAARNKALSLWAKKGILGLGSSILLLGTMPQLMNIFLTKRRIQRDFKASQAQVPQPRPFYPPPTIRQGETENMDFGFSSAQAYVPTTFRNMQSPYPYHPYRQLQQNRPPYPIPTYTPAAQFWRPVVF